MKDKIRQFVEEGFTIFPAAVDTSLIDAYTAEIRDLIAKRQNLKVSFVHNIRDISDPEVDVNRPLLKILDTYVHARPARNIIFSDTLLDFMTAVFQEPPLAFQSLHFEVGSTQALHQDTAYVVVDEPDNFVASWVALEDIQPGSGELVYIPGSHKFNKYYFDQETQRRHWNAEKDGNEQNRQFIQWLHAEAERLGLPIQKFSPKKGDVLFWHSNLAHGGGEITVPGSTRKSLVTHYCPVSNVPYYFNFRDKSLNKKAEVNPRAYIASMYFDLSGFSAQADHQSEIPSAIPSTSKPSLLARGVGKIKHILKQANLSS